MGTHQRKRAPVAEIQSFFIPGPLPGFNEIMTASNRPRGHNVKGKRWDGYNSLKRQVEQAISLVTYQLKPINEPARFVFRWAEKDKRRDPDNIVAAKKFILDALVANGILQGDGWRHVAGFADRWEVSIEPGVHVTIES